ncbi:alkaline phosphatase D family protein [Fulvivirga sedimenti]|uniref:Alkaline phosphatase D family protein n=1 Tax=Fulvivirga sedimenti TaxID=2879465 RepID=A0A9X1HUQ4_9BACT|nr:alkaline phosphatase D family protein [Fulvivirga sedimenti]MCA6078643.1 alkaline phosphatase D family protein [Fulvivirga sedimenti]
MKRFPFYTLLLLLLVACKSTIPDLSYEPGDIFMHGVASGDPLADRVIIWTRITIPHADSSVAVQWEMARDAEFRIPVQQGNFNTTAERDFTVKVDVGELRPGGEYYYRFKAYGVYSPVGRTRTAPAGSVDSLRFAVVSCSNYEWGYFNAYSHIAKQPDLAAVIHLGDYIYEYGPGVYGDTTIGRIHEPPYEIITLADYRMRYGQYRRDPDLQEVHKNHPFISIWDDHEIANNAYMDGAQNHQPEEGDFQVRRNVAKQVYYEWMPVREGGPLYRKFDFGPLATLIMLDERLAGRTAPVPGPDDSGFSSKERSMLGEEQFQWLTSQLVRTRSTWKIIGNQVIFSRLNTGRENLNLNMDAWDGYPYEQARLAEMFSINQFDNLIMVTGDTHSSWVFESTLDPFGAYNAKTGEGALAIELGTTSINSANSNESNPDSLVMIHERLLLSEEVNPHLKYVNLRDHGYLLLSLSPTAARADFYFVKSLRQRNVEAGIEARFWVPAGEYHILKSPPQD